MPPESAGREEQWAAYEERVRTEAQEMAEFWDLPEDLLYLELMASGHLWDRGRRLSVADYSQIKFTSNKTSSKDS